MTRIQSKEKFPLVFSFFTVIVVINKRIILTVKIKLDNDEKQKYKE